MALFAVVLTCTCLVEANDEKEIAQQYHPLVTDATVKLQSLKGEEAEFEAEEFSITAIEKMD